MIISLIVAASENDVIGKNNALPWHLPDELKYFRSVTQGKVVLMGRKTYESIGRPLPNRRNVVISSTLKSIPGCDVFATLEMAMVKLIEDDVPEVCVLGGARLFKTFLENTVLDKGMDRLYLTRVHATVDGDIFLPKIDWAKWKEVKAPVRHETDEKHAYAFTFHVFERRD